MREVVLDCETTGLYPAEGHRIIELACIELTDTRKGRIWHSYFNPGRDIPPEATAIHGLSDADVRHAPRFADKARDFLNFLDWAVIVAHNANFDMGFLNTELKLAGFAPLEHSTDTLAMARKKLPRKKHTLDALCDHYGVSRKHRTKHGALIDTHLLVDVYLRLTERIAYQETMDYSQEKIWISSNDGMGHTSRAQSYFLAGEAIPHPGRRQWPLPARLTEAEIEAHERFLDEFEDVPQWWL